MVLRLLSDLTRYEGFLEEAVLNGLERLITGLVAFAQESRRELVVYKSTEIEAVDSGSSQVFLS